MVENKFLTSSWKHHPHSRNMEVGLSLQEVEQLDKNSKHCIRKIMINAYLFRYWNSIGKLFLKN